MGKKDKDVGGFELSRRDFLKVAGAGAAAVAIAEPLMAAPAAAYTLDAGDTAQTFHTTCPYCSASCGQKVVVGQLAGKVYDIYGDVDSPINNGGLCAKGAGSLQLVNNTRRLGVNPTGSFPSADGAWKRTGNGAWTGMTLDAAFAEIAPALITARGDVSTAPHNSDGVMFFGCSHMNNEQNYLYRKLIATFGTSNVEHQARI